MRFSFWNRKLQATVGHFLGYFSWEISFRLLVLTLITYFLMSSQSKFQDISEVYGANELMLVGLSSVLFVFLLRFLHPITTTSTEEIVTRYRIQRKFGPGFIQGAVLGLGVTIAILLTGLYRYLGFFIQVDDAPLALLGILIRSALLVSLVYCEEFIFRHKIMNGLRTAVPDLAAAGITSLLFIGVKAVQFDLGVSQLLTLFLLSISLSLKTIVDGDFARGAGIWSGILVIFHSFFSLPIFGSDFQGAILIRYQSTVDAIELGASGAAGEELLRILTGGIGGPVSSLVLQLVFAFDIAQSIHKNKKILLNQTPRRLK